VGSLYVYGTETATTTTTTVPLVAKISADLALAFDNS